MLDIQGAVYARLSSDATLTAQLATYNSAPAVLADPPAADLVISEDKPVVIVASPSQQESEDDFSTAHRVAVVNVRLYHKPIGSTLKLDTAAERVRALLKNWGGAVTGGTVLDGEVSGPVPAPTDDPSIEGRLVTARLIIQET